MWYILLYQHSNKCIGYAVTWAMHKIANTKRRRPQSIYYICAKVIGEILHIIITFTCAYNINGKALILRRASIDDDDDVEEKCPYIVQLSFCGVTTRKSLGVVRILSHQVKRENELSGDDDDSKFKSPQVNVAH